MNQRPTHSWIARKPNGCLHDVILHDPAKILSVARNVVDWVRRGYVVDYVENSVVINALEPVTSIEQGKQQAAREYTNSVEAEGITA